MQLRQRHFIDSHKCSTAVAVLALMWRYDAFANDTAWVYLALHGTYGVLWTEEPRFRRQAVGRSRRPSLRPRHLGNAHLLLDRPVSHHVPSACPFPGGIWRCRSRSTRLGVFLHFASDMQKHTRLCPVPGQLFRGGLWAGALSETRTTSASSSSTLASACSRCIGRPSSSSALVIAGVWFPNMLRKGSPLSSYPGFAEWKATSRSLFLTRFDQGAPRAPAARVPHRPPPACLDLGVSPRQPLTHVPRPNRSRSRRQPKTRPHPGFTNISGFPYPGAELDPNGRFDRAESVARAVERMQGLLGARRTHPRRSLPDSSSAAIPSSWRKSRSGPACNSTAPRGSTTSTWASPGIGACALRKKSPSFTSTKSNTASAKPVSNRASSRSRRSILLAATTSACCTGRPSPLGHPACRSSVIARTPWAATSNKTSSPSTVSISRDASSGTKGRLRT